MNHDPALTQEEELALRELSRRQRESENAEARLIERYSARAALVKQVWGIALGCATGISVVTIYVFQLKADVSTSQRDLVELRTQYREMDIRLRNAELAMKDKADRAR